MKITVLVPTYRRTRDLERCLTALKQQTRHANEVLLVIRDSDEETWAFCKEYNEGLLPIHLVTVTSPGQVAALNAGLNSSTGDVIAITDDDAAPHPDWLERIEAHFLADARVGGVGGRDWVYHGTQLINGVCPVVGQVHWFGRVTGNHCFGVGNVREVDVLKGANMSYRRSAIGNLSFDERLLGIGAQVHNDMAFSLALKRLGWKLIYDPLVAVDHYTAQRFHEDQRDQFSSKEHTNAVHNETLVLLENLSLGSQLVFVAWSLLIGTRSAMGLLQLIRFLPTQKTLAIRKWIATMKGRLQGFQTWSRIDQ